jgi:hypothetical protein
LFGLKPTRRVRDLLEADEARWAADGDGRVIDMGKER